MDELSFCSQHWMRLDSQKWKIKLHGDGRRQEIIQRLRFMIYSSLAPFRSSKRRWFGKWKLNPGKALTADNLMKKNWPCNPDCALCYCILDTNKHILTECNFTKAVWDHYYWKVGGLGASCEMYALYQHLAAVLPLRCALWSSLQPLIEDGFIESWGSQFSFPVPLLSVQQSNQQKRWICMFNRSETLDFDFDYTKSKFIKFCHSAFVVSIKV